MANFKDPDTVLNLYRGVPIADGLNVVFTSRTAQADWFNEYRIKQVTAMTHIRHTTGRVQIQGEVGEVLTCDFLSFNNVAFGAGPIYARVTNAEYINPQNVEIFFEIDPWQTYMFDAQFRSSKIERQHLSQAAWAQAVANPYRNDIPELLTEEGLPVISDFEVEYARPSSRDIREDGKHSLAALNPPDNPLGPFPDPIEGGGMEGLMQTFSGGGYTNQSQSGAGTWEFAIVMQIADFEGSQPLKDMFSFQTIGHDSGYSNGFSRGFFLGAVPAYDKGQFPFPTDFRGHDSTGGGNTFADENFREILDYMTQNNITHRILGIWVVPSEVILYDFNNATTATTALMGGLDWHFMPEITVNLTDYNDLDGFGTVVNPKLRRAPFRTLRSTSPSGEVKTFMLERFNNVESGAVTLRAYGNFDDTPSLTIAPQRYDGQSLAFKDRLVFNAYPQVGYAIDGFLAHVGAQYQSAVLADSATDKHLRDQFGAERMVGRTFGDDLSDAWSAVTGLGADIRSGSEVAGRAMSQREDNNLLEQQNITNAAYGALSSGETNTAPFEHQRGALVGAGDYVAGNAAGSLGMRIGQLFFEFTLVTLRPEIIKTYDEYLTIYGYSNDRHGIPNVINRVRGEGPQPHFVSFDGLSFTYVKTNGLKTYGIPHVFARNISALFDGGCRFINGG